MVQTAKELMWLQYLLQDLGMSKYAPPILFCDNQDAISLTKNPIHHVKTKYVDVQLRFIRDHVEKGEDQCGILSCREYACGSHDKGTDTRKIRTIVGIDGSWNPMWTNRYVITSRGNWMPQHRNYEWEWRIMQFLWRHDKDAKNQCWSVLSLLDGSYSNCNEIKSGALTITGADHSGGGG